MPQPTSGTAIRPDEDPNSPSHGLLTAKVRVPHAEDLGETMKKIRLWLEQHNIHPASFRTTADPRGYLLTLDFHSDEAAELFRRQFWDAAARG